MQNENLSRSENERKNHPSEAEQIRNMADCHKLPELGMQALAEGWTPSEFNKRALVEVGERNNQVRSEPRNDHGTTNAQTPNHYMGMPCDNSHYGRVPLLPPIWASRP